MDSLTHIAIGSVVGMAVMGRRTPRWKAALWGGVCATLPDLDTFIDHGDPIRNMTFHRAESHALFYLTLAAPPIAWLISRIHREAGHFRRWWLAVWLALILHPLLDVMTVYGTQLALPFTDYPFGVGSIFIIDPLFTLPVLVGALVALLSRRTRSVSLGIVGLAISALYLAWTFAAQQHVTGIARDSLRAQGIEVQQLEVDPAAFSTVLWRVIAITPGGYVEGFYSLLDHERTLAFDRYPRDESLYQRLRTNWNVARVAWFTHGFFRMQELDGRVLITDLRLGMEPYYNFTFAVAERRGDLFVPIRPERAPPRLDAGPMVSWIWRRMRGATPRPPG